METTYSVTDQELFYSKVADVEIENLTGSKKNISIELSDGSVREFQGEFGPNDFEADYGFILTNEF